MLQLADCGLESLEALQACNGLREGVPLYYCKGEEGIFIIITLGRDLPEGHGMTVPRDSVTVLYIVWKGTATNP